MIFDSDYGPRAIISGDALRHNLSIARRYAPKSKIMAIIKANAYGHGLVPTAHALASADAFGVARLSEALMLREHQLTQKIILLEGVFNAHELEAVVNHHLDIVVHSIEQLRMLMSWRGTKSLQVWLKLDTGMNRLGFRVEQFAEVWSAINAIAAIGSIRLMTHLANADVTSDQQTVAQIKAFTASTADMQVEKSIANSAGLLAWPQAQVDWMRPGLMLYGVSPFPCDGARNEATDGSDNYGLRPAMTLQSRVIAIRDVKVGESVGYGGAWRAQRDGRIGIVAVGYGDGYPRLAANNTPVRVADSEAPIAGRVSMDMVAIDLSAIPAAKVGDVVTLWGDGLPVERIAQCAGTIPYDLICGISQRVSVEYR
jgi:alanine racemase